MNNTKSKPLLVAFSAAFVASIASSATADENPFVVTELKKGYMSPAQAKCGEGKCANKKKPDNARVEEKKAEGKCGEGKCAGKKKLINTQVEKKKAEAKCGEGKCAGKKKLINTQAEKKKAEAKCGGSHVGNKKKQ